MIEIKTHFKKHLDYFPSHFYSHITLLSQANQENFPFHLQFLSHSPDFKD